MAYTYAWSDPEQSSLRREDSEGNTVSIPVDSGNRDYQEYLEWVAEGNTPEPAE